MARVAELTVTKSKTVKVGDREEWVKAEYSLKAVVEHGEELTAVKAELESLIDGWLAGSVKPALTLAPLEIFPKEMVDLLCFEEKDGWVIAKPKAFLGSENFAKIAAIVKEYGGEYVSQGKNSHFRIPKTAGRQAGDKKG